MAGTLTGLLGALGGPDSYFGGVHDRLHPEASIRRGDLELRKQERAREIEARKRFREAVQNPEILGQLSQRLGVPQELISGAGSISELGALGRLVPAETAAPSSVREWQYFNSLDPDQQKQFLGMKRAQQIVNLGGTQAVLDPTGEGLSQEFPVTPKPEQQPDFIQSQEEAKVLGGGKITPIQQRAYNREESKLSAETGLRAAIDTSDNINTVVDEALGQASAWTTGFGSIASFVPGTPAADLKANLNTIEADAAFSALQDMRDRSKTGGALGQVSERELALLSSARAALSASQSPEQFKRNLSRYKKVRAKALDNTKKAYKKEFGVTFGAGKETQSGTISLEDFLAE